MATDQPRHSTGSVGGQWRARVHEEAPVALSSAEIDGRSEWAVGHEDVAWGEAPDMTASRRQRLAARGPYRASVPPEISRLTLDLDPEVVAEATEAAVAIARFDEEAARRLAFPGGPDDPGDAEVTPLHAVLLRTESASSSQIEKITANARSLALASIGEKTGPNARLVVRNAAAMQAARNLSDDITADGLIHVHAALLEESAPEMVGAFRGEAVWIGGSGSTPHTADFVPPVAARVPALVDDLSAFTRRVDVDALSHAAIAHAQFETVHPFPDGNGRVGRVLVHAMLRSAGVTKRMTVPVSSGLLADIDAYYEALDDYRAGNLNPVVEVFSQAAFNSVDNGRALAADLADTHDRWRSSLTARSDAAVWRALPCVISQPAVTTNHLAERLGVSLPAAERAIGQMVDAEVLVPVSAQRRNRVWTAPEVTAALDDFAVRAGRRRFRRG